MHVMGFSAVEIAAHVSKSEGERGASLVGRDTQAVPERERARRAVSDNPKRQDSVVPLEVPADGVRSSLRDSPE
jgi:hypothetical protein